MKRDKDFTKIALNLIIESMIALTILIWVGVGVLAYYVFKVWS